MKQIAALPEVEKHGWMIRLMTAVTDKLCALICQSEMGLSPLETSRFLYHSGFGSSPGVEEAMMAEALMRMKWDEGV